VTRQASLLNHARAGIFRWSFREPPASLPFCVKVRASVVRTDPKKDLALLEISVPHELTRAVVTGRPWSAAVGVSLAPFGEPTAFHYQPVVRQPVKRLVPGQSGSPVFSENGIVKMAYGLGHCSLSVGWFVRLDDIVAFLAADQPQGPAAPPK
jgi:hypothetical protein